MRGWPGGRGHPVSPAGCPVPQSSHIPARYPPPGLMSSYHLLRCFLLGSWQSVHHLLLDQGVGQAEESVAYSPEDLTRFQRMGLGRALPEGSGPCGKVRVMPQQAHRGHPPAPAQGRASLLAHGAVARSFASRFGLDGVRARHFHQLLGPGIASRCAKFPQETCDGQGADTRYREQEAALRKSSCNGGQAVFPHRDLPL